MHSVFRLVMLALVVGYSLPRVYYRRRARHARMKEESTRPPVTESKWRLAFMGISGGGANLVGLAWLVNPDWLSWSNLDLPVWLRWVGTGLGCSPLCWALSRIAPSMSISRQPCKLSPITNWSHMGSIVGCDTPCTRPFLLSLWQLS